MTIKKSEYDFYKKVISDYLVKFGDKSIQISGHDFNKCAIGFRTPNYYHDILYCGLKILFAVNPKYTTEWMVKRVQELSEDPLRYFSKTHLPQIDYSIWIIQSTLKEIAKLERETINQPQS